jgi:oligopeptidase B
MLDDTILLTTGEYDEWGIQIWKKYYGYMKSYSPYDNVKLASLSQYVYIDWFAWLQVQYWEPAMGC